jgi:hypothetical protein
LVRWIIKRARGTCDFSDVWLSVMRAGVNHLRGFDGHGGREQRFAVTWTFPTLTLVVQPLNPNVVHNRRFSAFLRSDVGAKYRNEVRVIRGVCGFVKNASMIGIEAMVPICFGASMSANEPCASRMKKFGVRFSTTGVGTGEVVTNTGLSTARVPIGYRSSMSPKNSPVAEHSCSSRALFGVWAPAMVFQCALTNTAFVTTCPPGTTLAVMCKSKLSSAQNPFGESSSKLRTCTTTSNICFPPRVTGLQHLSGFGTELVDSTFVSVVRELFVSVTLDIFSCVSRTCTYLYRTFPLALDLAFSRFRWHVAPKKTAEKKTTSVAEAPKKKVEATRVERKKFAPRFKLFGCPMSRLHFVQTRRCYAMRGLICFANVKAPHLLHRIVPSWKEHGLANHPVTPCSNACIYVTATVACRTLRDVTTASTLDNPTDQKFRPSRLFDSDEISH